MKQLNIQDVGFLYQETANTPMHISGLGIYDYSTAKRPRTKKDIVQYVERRIHIAPIMKQKLKHVPGGWDRPFWVDDEDFDYDNHIFHVGLPPAGNLEELNTLVSRLLARPLDLTKPLWEMYVIEGLKAFDGLGPNSFGILTKIHHCCIDGASGSNVMGALHDLAVNAQPLPISSNTSEAPEDMPGKYEMLAKAYASNVVSSFEQTAAVSRKLPSLLKTAAALYKGEKKAGARLSVPETRFNKTPSRERSFASMQFSLDEIKTIKNTFPGTTVNDVMACIVAGGLRSYLDAHDELPGESLGAMMPQNIRTEENKDDTYGNAVGGLFVSLHSDIEDPVERLLAISQSTSEAKQFAQDADTAAVFPSLMCGFLYPNVGKLVGKAAQNLRVMERLGPVVLNTLVTNVPGPNFPLFHDGAQMVGYRAAPPLTDGIGIAHAIYSYCGQISLSVVACREAMKDSEFYMQCCEQTFEKLWSKTQRKNAKVNKKTKNVQQTPPIEKQSVARRHVKKTVATNDEALAEVVNG